MGNCGLSPRIEPLNARPIPNNPSIGSPSNFSADRVTNSNVTHQELMSILTTNADLLIDQTMSQLTDILDRVFILEQKVRSMPSDNILDQAPLTRAQASAGGLFLQGTRQDKAKFLCDEWIPFLKTLRSEILHVHCQVLAGVPLDKRGPSQELVHSLSERCLKLTTQWHGRPNLSAMYAFLIGVGEASNFVAAPDLCICRAHDKPLSTPRKPSIVGAHIVIHDSEKLKSPRYLPSLRKTYSQSVTSRIPTVASSSSNCVRTPWPSGLGSSMLSKTEAQLWLAKGQLKKLLMATICYQQLVDLKRISEEFTSSDIPLVSADALRNLPLLPPSEVQAVLKAISNSPGASQKLSSLGISTLGASFQTLLKFGEPVCDWSIIRQNRIDLYNCIVSSICSVEERKKLGKLTKIDETLRPETSIPVLCRFLEFAQQHPGSYFESSKALHKQLLLSGLLLQSLCGSDTTADPEHVLYIQTEWIRSTPLVIFQSNEDKKVSETLRRNVDETEFMRFARYTKPIFECHGCGTQCDESDSKSLFPANKLFDSPDMTSDMSFCDFESICQQAILLNANGGTAALLPGEDLFEINQDPCGSEYSEHSHVSLSVDPCSNSLLLFHNKPLYISSISSAIDLVQVGESPDAFFFRLQTIEPVSTDVLSILHDIRLMLVSHFGATNICFSFSVLPSVTGWFNLILAPMAVLKRVSRPNTSPEITGPCERRSDSSADPSNSHLSAMNLDTLEYNSNYLLPDSIVNVDTPKARLNTTLTAAQRLSPSMLGDFFDFVRKTGSRKLVRDLLASRFAYIDTIGQCTNVTDYRATKCGYTKTGSSVFIMSPLLSCTHEILRMVDQIKRDCLLSTS